MSTVSLELENVLHELDPASASSLERIVRDLLQLARQRHGATPPSRDSNGYPSGHFERLTGSWADVDFSLPADPPPQPSPEWS